MLLLVILLALAFPSEAAVGPSLRVWQAKRVDSAYALENLRPDFRVERAARINRRTVRVCWSEPGYVLPMDGRDYGCDLVQRRSYEWWIRDDSVGSPFWVRWL